MFLQIWVLGFRGFGLGTRFHGLSVKGICVGGAKSGGVGGNRIWMRSGCT